MEQPKGEFEQRPEVKPAEQIPLPKERVSPTIKALCLFFAIIALGAGGYILYDKVIAKKETTNCETIAEDSGKKIESEEEQRDEGATAPKEKALGSYNGFVSSADSSDTFYVTSKGEAYFVLAKTSYGSKRNDLKNDSVLGERGNYTLSPKELNNFITIGDDSVSFDGYKLPYDNIVYANELRFGNGDISRYIVMIDKSNKFYAIALDNTGGTRDSIELTARVIGRINEYDGAIATLETNEGSGIDNIVYFKDGSYKTLDYKKFSKQ